jgi:hypothetical protein
MSEKKGLLGRLIGKKKEAKKSCCCNFKIEEIPEETVNEKEPKNSSVTKDNSCCNK